MSYVQQSINHKPIEHKKINYYKLGYELKPSKNNGYFVTFIYAVFGIKENK